jgi:protease I
MAQDTLKGLKVAILVTDGLEKVELTEPRKALDEAGAETRIVSLKSDRSAAGILRIGTRSSPST